MNLLDLHPEILADQYEPAAAREAMKALDELTLLQRESLEYALAFWVSQALARPADLEGVLQLNELCALAARRSGAGAESFIQTLAAWRVLLEHKRLAIGVRAATVRPQQHDAVVWALANNAGGPMTQNELARALDVSPGRISQLLGVMEQQGTVTRRRVGNRNEVELVGTVEPAKPAQSAGRSAAKPLRLIKALGQ